LIFHTADTLVVCIGTRDKKPLQSNWNMQCGIPFNSDLEIMSIECNNFLSPLLTF